MKQEMKILHEKNMEIYELKQKIKDEKQQKEAQRLQIELNKKEKKLKEYYEGIKIKSERFKDEKNEKEKTERDLIEKELQQKLKKTKEEVKLKLPIITQRQNKAEDIFIMQCRAKEIKANKKEEDQIRINQIIENLKIRPKVDIDPERVKQLTENLTKRFNTKRDETDKVVLFENHGFTVDKLMGDLRYKVSTVLGEAGLLNRQYTNDFLRNLYKGD